MIIKDGVLVFAIIEHRKKDEIAANLSKIKIPFLNNQLSNTTHPDICICKNKMGGPVILKGMDRYLHTLLIGVTGSGKTSAVLEPMIWQDLQNYRNGHQLGITIVAPDSEFPNKVRNWCQRLGIPYYAVDLDDPNSIDCC